MDHTLDRSTGQDRKLMVEVYNDVALRRCPITRSEAQAMIAEVKGARLLQGFRG